MHINQESEYRRYAMHPNPVCRSVFTYDKLCVAFAVCGIVIQRGVRLMSWTTLLTWRFWFVPCACDCMMKCEGTNVHAEGYKWEGRKKLAGSYRGASVSQCGVAQIIRQGVSSSLLPRWRIPGETCQSPRNTKKDFNEHSRFSRYSLISHPFTQYRLSTPGTQPSIRRPQAFSSRKIRDEIWYQVDAQPQERICNTLLSKEYLNLASHSTTYQRPRA